MFCGELNGPPVWGVFYLPAPLATMANQCLFLGVIAILPKLTFLQIPCLPLIISIFANVRQVDCNRARLA